eukprot:403365551
MFNFSNWGGLFDKSKILGGANFADQYSHRLLYAGADPSDNSRVLLKKLIQVSNSTYCYEETTITPVEGKSPSVHTKIYRLKNFDLHENVEPLEANYRNMYRPLPHAMGFSLYFRDCKETLGHMSIVENTLFKPASGTWSERFQDFKDRRDMSAYLRSRWGSF